MVVDRIKWFVAFTAVFAVGAAIVFWGTWSTDVVPVMPDCATNFVPWGDYLSDWFRGWVTNGKFVPDDLKIFLASPWVWVELQYALAAYLAALGMAYFLRGHGLTRLASYGAGLLLAFSGYWFTLFSAGHLGWFRWMTYGVFAFGLADRALRRNGLRHWLLLGATVAWGSFYQPDLWLLFTAFTGVYFVYRSIVLRKFHWKGTSAAAAVFLAIGAPSFYNAFVNDLAGRDQQIEEGKARNEKSKSESGEAKSDEDRWIFTTNWSLPPAEIAEAFIPRLNGDTSCVLTQALGAKAGTGVTAYTGALGRPLNAPEGNYRQHSLYIGFITCLFALFGLVSLFLRRNRAGEQSEQTNSSEIVFFAVAAAVFAVFSFGRYCEGVYRLVYALPFGDYLRAPVKWHHLTEFCVVVLAGFGIDAAFRLLCRRGTATEQPDSPNNRTITLVIAAVVLLGVFDLVRVDRKYCAPVDMTDAKAKNADMQMTFLRKQDFNHPQVAGMVQAGMIKSLAYYPGNRDVYLVGILKPRPPRKEQKMPLPSLATWLGTLSLAGTLGVTVLSLAMVCWAGEKKNKIK